MIHECDQVEDTGIKRRAGIYPNICSSMLAFVISTALGMNIEKYLQKAEVLPKIQFGSFLVYR